MSPLIRPQERDYAKLPATAHPETNRYGKPIELVPVDDPLAGKSLRINGNHGVSDNPDRYKQHGFYFNADNCISCHACEAACSEKNDLPAHIAFRSVGYLEGGSYPASTRMNISMACNHCDDPVCLKGCPTRAYTKFAEYGAVLQDPDICFGCGYCTWVCPYNAPQLDTQAGHVSKCNMCVDRLELGLKPACASACLAGALDFGVIETKPQHREMLDAQIPGFPSPEITHPNIRFQQAKSLPREMRRTDSAPIRYERDDATKTYRPKVAEDGRPRAWNLKKLRSREDPLVIFTLVSQLVVGAFLLLFLGGKFGLAALSPAAHPALHATLLIALLGFETIALVLSTLHLGRPHRFYRAFNNLRYSPVSREVAAIAVFYNLLGGYTLFTALSGAFAWLPASWVAGIGQACGWGAVVAGPAALYFMSRIYRIASRPFWNHWQVLTSFYGSMLALGALAVALPYGWTLWAQGEAPTALLAPLAGVVALGVLLEGVGLVFHVRHLNRIGGEGAAAHYLQRTDFGYTWITRNLGMAVSLTGALALAATDVDGMAVWSALAALVVASALVGRALFYVLVIPTTMPGAFFWRNKGFEEHARATGLAELPQVGVLPCTH
ncbi:MAG: dimethyl sulfoxide reductase anchor subunit [Hydrogenophilales bacterium]|nr:dimethyl sulfoxide reductase anchor subunit [Hydrogenophilales bacterium]